MTPYEHVPTLPDLHAQGLAEIVHSGKQGTFYRASPEGQRIIEDTMRWNAVWAQEHPVDAMRRLYDAVSSMQAEAAATKKKK